MRKFLACDFGKWLRKKIDQCENCMDDRSCTESIFPCAPECADIVP